MAQNVFYADLRFAKGPGGHGTVNQVLEAASTDDTDSPYENVVPGSAPTGTAGKETQHNPEHWSRRRCIPVGLLAASLLLLQQAWQEGNSSQQELARWEAKLLHVTGALNVSQKELQDVRGKLSAIEQAVSSLQVCLNADCCPLGWLLYRGKCLFISVVKKNWWESYWDCKGKSSQLLVQGGWESWILPHFLQADGAKYWIR
ncbi:CD72 protein, partial [Odontophorus gujanensis]|nr:CD72 protein [Odontophorus gujanensis]